MGGGLVFLSLSFFVFLPLIIIAPSKFAMTFTLGCMCVLASFAALRGWQQQVKDMFVRERLPYTAGAGRRAVRVGGGAPCCLRQGSCVQQMPMP
jgi:hypothetical protein